MTTNQTIKKIKEILKENQPQLLKNCKRLLNSGGIDKSKYNKNDYILSKIVLSVALDVFVNSIKPYSEDYKEDLENLKNF